jgi:uncharacterized SAM-binding protein YcdF (DUF218 family)
MKVADGDIERLGDSETATPSSPPYQEAVSALNRRRKVKYAAALFAGIVLVAFSHVPILRGIASFLIVEDSLASAAAIVALGGQTPFREIEAAKLYHAGLAPQVVIVREAPTAESQALQHLGVTKVPQWELARAVLIQQGVPDAAIIIPEDDAVGTLEELQAVWGALGARSWVLGVDPVLGHPSSVVRTDAVHATAINAKDVRGEALGVRGAAEKEQGAGSMEPELGREASGVKREEAEAQSSPVTGLRSSDQTQATQLTRNAGTQHGATVSGRPSSVAVEKDVRGEASGVRGQARGQRSEVRSWEEECAVSGLGCSVLASVSGHRSPVALSVASDAKSATNAERNNAMNANNALPVILVTSKYHTRRTRLTWQYVTGGQSQPIVRAATGDPFDPERWWHTRAYALSVVREYLGLANYYAGFPVAP